MGTMYIIYIYIWYIYIYIWYHWGHLIDTPPTNQGPTWRVIMNQAGFVGRYVLVQGLEQIPPRIETMSARSFRVLAFPCLASLALLELWARTCGDAFCGSRPRITNRRMARITLQGSYCRADLCVGWILNEKDVEAGRLRTGSNGTKTLKTVMSGWEMMEKASMASCHWVGVYSMSMPMKTNWSST